MIVHLCLVLILIAILMFKGYSMSIYYIQILFYMPLMFMFFTTLSWATATISCISKDFEKLIWSIITALFWLSGIIWNPYSLQNELLKKIILLNPINYLQMDIEYFSI